MQKWGLFQFAEERLSSVRLVKGFAKEGEEMRKYGERVDSVLDTATKEVMGHTLFYTMVRTDMMHTHRVHTHTIEKTLASLFEGNFNIFFKILMNKSVMGVLLLSQRKVGKSTRLSAVGVEKQTIGKQKSAKTTFNSMFLVGAFSFKGKSPTLTVTFFFRPQTCFRIFLSLLQFH